MNVALQCQNVVVFVWANNQNHTGSTNGVSLGANGFKFRNNTKIIQTFRNTKTNLPKVYPNFIWFPEWQQEERRPNDLKRSYSTPPLPTVF